MTTGQFVMLRVPLQQLQPVRMLRRQAEVIDRTLGFIVVRTMDDVVHLFDAQTGMLLSSPNLTGAWRVDT